MIVCLFRGMYCIVIVSVGQLCEDEPVDALRKHFILHRIILDLMFLINLGLQPATVCSGCCIWVPLMMPLLLDH